MIRLKLNRMPALKNASLLAESECCCPILWLALCSTDEVDLMREGVDNVWIVCDRNLAIERLSAAIPFIARLNPNSIGLEKFASEFQALLKSRRREFLILDFDKDGWANRQKIRVAVHALEHQVLDASFYIPARTILNPFTNDGTKMTLIAQDFSSTAGLLNGFCGYEYDYGEEERGPLIGYQPNTQ